MAFNLSLMAYKEVVLTHHRAPSQYECPWLQVFSLSLLAVFCSVFGSLNLTTVKLSGVGSSFQKHADAESKGIKAHFNMDESGVLLLDRVSYTNTNTNQFQFPSAIGPTCTVLLFCRLSWLPWWSVRLIEIQAKNTWQGNVLNSKQINKSENKHLRILEFLIT